MSAPNPVPDPVPADVDAAGKAVDALGVAFDDEGPYSPEMATAALTGLGTCVTYLRVCLGPAQPAAIPDAATLAAVLLALHAACAQLQTGLHDTLRAIDRPDGFRHGCGDRAYALHRDRARGAAAIAVRGHGSR